MMKFNHIFKIMTVLALCGLNTACNDDSLSNQSIFNTQEVKKNDFDKWLQNNYITPYNIDLMYKWNDSETNMSFDLSPANIESSILMAKAIKYGWIEAYDEVAGVDFTRRFIPKQIMLVGSPAFDSDTKAVTFGTAEGGLKVVLYVTNSIKTVLHSQEQVNEYYFGTMHHEFCHILHQTVPYDKQFERITASGYVGNDWYMTSDENARKKGFITAYAMNLPEDDFVETYCRYITHDEAWWNSVLEQAGETGKPILLEKFNILKNYLLNTWNIDIDQMRNVVMQRTTNLSSLNTELK